MERNGDLIGTFERKQRMRALYRGEIMINSELGDIQKLIDEDRKAEAAERYFDVFRVIRAHCRVNRLISARLVLLIAFGRFAIVCDRHAPQRKIYEGIIELSLSVLFVRFYISGEYIRLDSRSLGRFAPEYWWKIFAIGEAVQMPAVQRALLPQDIFYLCNYWHMRYGRIVKAHSHSW